MDISLRMTTIVGVSGLVDCKGHFAPGTEYPEFSSFARFPACMRTEEADKHPRNVTLSTAAFLTHVPRRTAHRFAPRRPLAAVRPRYQTFPFSAGLQKAAVARGGTRGCPAGRQARRSRCFCGAALGLYLGLNKNHPVARASQQRGRASERASSAVSARQTRPTDAAASE